MTSTRVRGRATALLTCVVGAGLVVAVAGRVWAHVGTTPSAGTLAPAGPSALTGRDLAPLAYACALAALAGALALLVTGGRGRRLLGGLLVVLGCAVVVSGVRSTGAGEVRSTAQVTGAVPVDLTLWPWLSHLGGLLVVVAGLLAAAYAHRWAAPSTRYEVSGQRGRPDTSAEVGPEGLWAALDRGEDPTREDPADGSR